MSTLAGAQAEAKIARLRNEGFEELDLQATSRSGLFADSSGQLWRRMFGEPRNGRHRPLDHGFVIAQDGRPAWYQRPEWERCGLLPS